MIQYTICHILPTVTSCNNTKCHTERMPNIATAYQTIGNSMRFVDKMINLLIADDSGIINSFVAWLLGGELTKLILRIHKCQEKAWIKSRIEFSLWLLLWLVFDVILTTTWDRRVQHRLYLTIKQADTTNIIFCGNGPFGCLQASYF
jgi:hypothetical protein